MSNLISMGLVILVLCIVSSRSISKQALELLSDEEKSKLAEKFARFGRVNQIPIVMVFAGYVLIKYLHPSFSTIAFVVLILFFITFLVITSVLILKKMKDYGLPTAYVRKYKQSRMVYNFGFTACGVTLLYDLLK